MKNEGALRMRFLRHVGIYRSDVSFVLFTPGACPAFRSGRCQGIGHTGKNMPCPSSAMSSGRLFLDQVARQHCLSPLRRKGHHKTLDQRIETNYHRTARCGLSGCLTLGVHPNLAWRPLVEGVMDVVKGMSGKDVGIAVVNGLRTSNLRIAPH